MRTILIVLAILAMGAFSLSACMLSSEISQEEERQGREDTYK